MQAPYARWVLDHDTLTDEDRRLIRAHVALLPRQPLISVVMPAYETPERLLREAVASVRAQLYPRWELCVADDASPSPHVASILREAAAADLRVRWVRRPENGHISAATNTALALARGEFIALMDHDDLLPEHALYEVAVEAAAHPDADVIYSDEDRIDENGRRFDPYFKPMWSPELLTGHNVISHLGVYRRALVERLGGFRLGYEGSQDWDLALRATAAATPDRVRHIPAVLYHWRLGTGTPSFSEAWLARCQDAGRRAVEDWLAGEGIAGARVEPARLLPGSTRVAYPVPDPAPLVSVIMPTRDHAALLDRACAGVLHGTDWPAERIELLVVDNGSVAPEALGTLRRIEGDPRARVLRAPGPFNYARLNNLAARQARGEILLLLNNDIEVVEPGWLRELAGLALRPEVGAVGAKLLYPDGRVQHGGVAMGPDGTVRHLLPFTPRDDPGYFGQLGLARALSAVTGACMALRRAVFEEAGGLDEALAVTFNDTDLCLRIRDLGYRVAWTPDAVLLHHESATRGAAWELRHPDRAEAEWQFMRRRWGRVLDEDPYQNPNLLLHEGGGPLIPAPPRRVRPWRRAALAGMAA